MLIKSNKTSGGKLFGGSLLGALFAMAALSGCGGGGRPSNVLDPAVTAGRTLSAALVASDPTIDGAVDGVWNSAEAISLPLGDGMGEEPDCALCHALNSQAALSLKAVYTAGGNISILAKWSDSTASFTRGSSWTYDAADADGNGWTKSPSSGQNEDRIAFFWPIGDIMGTAYNTGGCMTKCHTSDSDGDGAFEDDESFLSSGSADLWHGKSGRALGALGGSQSGVVIDPDTHEATGGSITLNGYMDDTQVKNLTAMGGTVASHGNGRASDAGSSAASSNSVSNRPKYMETNPTDYVDAMVLTQSEIDGGETVGSSATGVSEADAAIYWANYAALEAIVPERILKVPTLSLGDIRQSCTWSNGWWTCEIQRSLLTTTGTDTNTDGTNADDVQFDTAEEYIFGVSIMENGGGVDHKASDKHTLKFLQ